MSVAVDAATLCSKLSSWESLLSSYRSSELRNLLVQQLGADTAQVAKILDKAELRTLAGQLIGHLRTSQCNLPQIRWTWSVTPTAPLIISLTLIVLCCLTANRWVRRMVRRAEFLPHMLRLKVKLLAKATKRGRWLLGLLVLSSMSLELLVGYVQLSVLLSFVLPERYSYLRGALLLGPSLPLTTSMLGTATGLGAGAGGYGLNIGPMLLVFALRSAMAALDKQAGRIIEEPTAETEAEEDHEVPGEGEHVD